MLTTALTWKNARLTRLQVVGPDQPVLVGQQDGDGGHAGQVDPAEPG